MKNMKCLIHFLSPPNISDKKKANTTAKSISHILKQKFRRRGVKKNVFTCLGGQDENRRLDRDGHRVQGQRGGLECTGKGHCSHPPLADSPCDTAVCSHQQSLAIFCFGHWFSHFHHFLFTLLLIPVAGWRCYGLGWIHLSVFLLILIPDEGFSLFEIICKNVRTLLE